MADVASTAAEAKVKTPTTRPEKPDEDAYKKGLAAKEKEHKAKQDALVREILISY